MLDKEKALKLALEKIQREFSKPNRKRGTSAARKDVIRLRKRKYDHFWMHE